ncbi:MULTISPECIES: hypothetical protein, partial [unclassified Sinorhizobium]|uniref:hypothetical protein n=1 Tax=unclassified Sinorhizobium TaxID=2613772 RepID=UPI003526B147
QFDQSLRPEGRFGFAGEAKGDSLSPDGRNPYVLNLNGMVSDGRLSLSWTYMPGALSRQTVERLVADFKDRLALLIDHSLKAEPRRTASDFVLSGLNQSELERLSLPLADVEDIYPATDLQQGLLFHGML